ncbi:hypothetical protein DPMN_121821 [Dreissena polymorpha]|uniref:Tudor domain-containing protein n=1 Tax=Dreissena polymorpha TaxID=45954 RepID=A0A9D4GNI2_DREPO|nr:hypothetical protein DPMN_121821 [Dreissena polymorpha]
MLKKNYNCIFPVIFVSPISNKYHRFLYFKVFYLDFGNTEWLPETELCDILPEFLHLPFQALECFLDNIHPTPPAAWSKDAV